MDEKKDYRYNDISERYRKMNSVFVVSATFLWAMFLHAGIEHIFNNMVLLFFLGAMIEKVTGHVTFLVLYFLSGIGGNL